MRVKLLCASLLCLSVPAQAEEIVKLPRGSASDVSRPDDLFALPPGEWQYAKHLWEGREPCLQEQCEAGFTSGDMVVSVEHSGKNVRIIAGLRNCTATAFSEMETGRKPGKSTRKRVAKQVETVAKGLAKSCSTTVPAVAPLDAALLFPQPAPAPPKPAG